MKEEKIKEGFYRKGGIRPEPSTSKPDFIPPPQKNIDMEKITNINKK